MRHGNERTKEREKKREREERKERKKERKSQDDDIAAAGEEGAGAAATPATKVLPGILSIPFLLILFSICPLLAPSLPILFLFFLAEI